MMQSYARDALDELDVLEEELLMLAMREDELELQELAPSSAASSAAYVPYKAMDPNRPGIQFTRTYKAGDQLVMRCVNVCLNACVRACVCVWSLLLIVYRFTHTITNYVCVRFFSW